MKKTVLITLMVIYYSNSFSQEKATLTKGETINYLNKKIKETDGQEATWNPWEGDDRQYFWSADNTIYLDNDNVTVEYQYSNYGKNASRMKEELRQRANGNTYTYQTVRIYPCDYYEKRILYKLNPAHIVSVQNLASSGKSGAIGYVEIALVNAVSTQKNKKWTTESYFRDYGIESNEAHCYSLNSTIKDYGSIKRIYFPFLSSDPSNFEKIKKALNHLAQLYKAEDDPFGN
ncbi:MAG: hypothetical protein JWR72_3618 [Flavisolibacter sp.]|jgi:hypothetical protein|nr:hypothetical protein [Flavisolibacter sp.]